MKMVNIAEAKAHLSDLLDQVAAGAHVLICKRNQPVAELRAVAAARTDPRPLGLAAGAVTIPAAFFDPLPDDLLDAFEPREPVGRVADGRVPVGAPKGRRPRGRARR